MSNKTLYIGNLSYSSNSEGLLSAFSAYGAKNVRIVEGRGFAFLDVDADQMSAAIEAMNGKSVDGRTIVVNEARARENSGGGGGGGRSGGPGGARSGGGGGGGQNFSKGRAW